MKLKIIEFIIILNILNNIVHCQKKTCNPTILTSLGFTSRITPNRVNVVCPQISENCCTNRDQMKIHKTWKLVTSKLEKIRQRQLIGKMKSMNIIFATIDSLDFENLNQNFEDKSPITPSAHLLDHLSNLASQIKKQNSKFLKKINYDLTKNRIRFYYWNLHRFRKATLCMFCDFKSQSFINLEGMTITFSNRFCKAIVDKFYKYHDLKYNVIFKHLMYVDEWVNLTSGRRLFTEDERIQYKRYFKVLKDCKSGNCKEYCAEFNVNARTPMFDGEIKTYTTFSHNASEFYNDISKSEVKYFAEFDKNWELSDFQEYLKYESIFATEHPPNPNISSDEFTGQIAISPKSYVEVNHARNSVQIQTLDDEWDVTKIFKSPQEAVDVSTFLSQFNNVGINLDYLSKKMNFKLQPEQLLGLIHFQSRTSKVIDEIIEPRVNQLVLQVQKIDIVDFSRDYGMAFRKLKVKLHSANAVRLFKKRRQSMVQKMMFRLKKMFRTEPPYPHPDF